MARHVMVERDDFFVSGRGMEMHESGMVSVDIWNAMVDALRAETVRNVDALSPFSSLRFSRGRHHKCEECPYEEGARCQTQLTECR